MKERVDTAVVAGNVAVVVGKVGLAFVGWSLPGASKRKMSLRKRVITTVSEERVF